MLQPSPKPLRHSMALLHTWAGVVLGSVLFAIFWMGTLSVFDREIDRWMMPATRLGAVPAVSLDAVARSAAELAPAAPQWSVTLPNERTPTLQLRYPGPDGSVLRHIDPAAAAPIDPPGTLGGTGFIFPFHFMLHLDWLDLGIWLVGLCGMAMLVLVVSGVIIHQRLFRDFFMFRPKKALSRSTLDLHTAMGVLAMPFHFIMPLSGLIIFFSLFFPGTWQAAFNSDRAAFNREVFGGYQRPKLDAPGRLASLDAMTAEAERRWGGREPHSVRVLNPADAASVVEIRRSPKDEVSMNRDAIYFDGVSGAVLGRFESKPVGSVQRFISGIHFVQFDNWLLRWLYFAGGLAGCVMIATGFLFWLESRRAEHAREGLRGVRVVEALATGSVTGIIGATLAFFVINRCLPLQAQWLGLERAELEVLGFYAVWLLTFGHAALRPRVAWSEQSALVGALAALAVALNWLTTGDHPLRAIQRGVFAVAGMDGLLVCLAALGFIAARRLSRARATRPVRQSHQQERTEAAAAPADRKVAHG
jgi:uncharacterized iron-regulated membrane protein